MAIDKSAAIEMRRQGATMEHIAQRFGVSESYISKMLRCSGLEARRRRSNTYYTVYLAATDEIVASGDAYECAELMGLKNVMSFYSIVSHTSKGRTNKYIFVTDKEETSDERESLGGSEGRGQDCW